MFIYVKVAFQTQLQQLQ